MIKKIFLTLVMLGVSASFGAGAASEEKAAAVRKSLSPALQEIWESVLRFDLHSSAVHGPFSGKTEGMLRASLNKKWDEQFCQEVAEDLDALESLDLVLGENTPLLVDKELRGIYEGIRKIVEDVARERGLRLPREEGSPTHFVGRRKVSRDIEFVALNGKPTGEWFAYL